MQRNYRFNDILLPGQNWSTDQPANASGQRVRKRDRPGGARTLRYPRTFGLYASRPTSSCVTYKLKETTKIVLYFASQRHGLTLPFLIHPCNPPPPPPPPTRLTIYRSDLSGDETGKARRGGVCILVNDRWATDVKNVLKSCSADIQTHIYRPFYLPRAHILENITSYVRMFLNMADSYLAAKIRKIVFLKALRIFAAKKIHTLRRKSRRISRRFLFVVTAIVIDIYFRLYTLLQFDLCTRA